MNLTIRKLPLYVSTLLAGIALAAAIPGCAPPDESSTSPQVSGQQDAGQQVAAQQDAGSSPDSGQTDETIVQTTSAVVTNGYGQHPPYTQDAITFWSGQNWPNFGPVGQWATRHWNQSVPFQTGSQVIWFVVPRTDYIFGGGRYRDQDRQLSNYIHGQGPPHLGPSVNYTFVEYDVNFYWYTPHRRNKLRIVRCEQTGAIFYTSDHYANFIQIL